VPPRRRREERVRRSDAEREVIRRHDLDEPSVDEVSERRYGAFAARRARVRREEHEAADEKEEFDAERAGEHDGLESDRKRAEPRGRPVSRDK
jgi:hypothetical protein